MKQFFNPELQAPNVLKVPIDSAIARELLPLWEGARRKFYSKAPAWKSDVQWLSARNEIDFVRFQSVFDRLGIAAHVEPYLDLDRGVRLYSGFFVIRTRCTEPDFHLDWRDTNNEAFTLLTPLSSNAAGFGLLYKKADGSIGEYEYRLGEALVLGDDFVHSTKPGTSEEPVVLLSFTFGSDKMEHWPSISRTAASQGMLVRRPDGSFERTLLRKRVRAALGKVARAAGLRRTTRSDY
ncbi:MAG TPA: hypothetical protein VF757_10880 [Sphingomicrobium sp.]